MLTEAEKAFKLSVFATDDVTKPNSSIWVDEDTVPAGKVTPAPKPLLTADADINVSLTNDAVKAVSANDALSTKPSTSLPDMYDDDADAVINPKASIWAEDDTVPVDILPVPKPKLAADWEVRYPDEDIWADSE